MSLTRYSEYLSVLLFKFLTFYVLGSFLGSYGTNPWYSKTLETLPSAFDARWNLAIVILERMQAHSSSCCSTSALSSLRTKAPFLFFATLGLHFSSTSFVHSCTPTHLPRGYARNIRIRGRRDVCIKGSEGEGFNIVRTFQSVYDCIDSTACRHLAKVSNHRILAYRVHILPVRYIL